MSNYLYEFFFHRGEKSGKMASRSLVSSIVFSARQSLRGGAVQHLRRCKTAGKFYNIKECIKKTQELVLIHDCKCDVSEIEQIVKFSSFFFLIEYLIKKFDDISISPMFIIILI